MTGIQRVVLERVTRVYSGVAALRRVSLSLEAGEIAVIEGPNGAGKSTLLGIVGTIVRPSQGCVTYPPFGSDRTAVRRCLGWVSHESQCYPDLCGRENVELAARLHGLPTEAAWKDVSTRLNAGAFGERRFGTLSRGQRQRIALARALVHSPSLLLMDEPATGLDRDSVGTLEEILREEATRGSVVVVVSHRAGLARRLGARPVRLERGQLVESS